MKVAKDCYLLASNISPKHHSLTNQINRASVSVPANIAEGYGRRTDGAYIQFLRISKGSLNELETLLILAQDCEIVNVKPEMFNEISLLGSKLTLLIRAIQSSGVKEEMKPYGDVELD